MTNKKKLIKHYKAVPPKMAIFQIKNLVNGKIFIGRGINVRGIINSSKFQLDHGSHPNSGLQNDF